MFFLKINENYKVIFKHNMPFDAEDGLGKTAEELELEGILVEHIPEPEDNGKISVLFCNPATKELWYEYEEIPKIEEQLGNERLEQLEGDLGAILLDRAMDKAKITELELSQGALLMEVAMLKTGGIA